MGHKKEKKIHRALKIYGVWALLVVLVNLAAGVVPGLGGWYIDRKSTRLNSSHMA